MKQRSSLLLFLLLLLSPQQHHASSSSIFWRFTVRDFLPAACFHSYQELSDIWTYSVINGEGYSGAFESTIPIYPNSTETLKGRYRGNDTSFCPIFNDIADGKYNGHPDFEVCRSPAMYAEAASGCFSPLTSPLHGGISCQRVNTAVNIEERFMTNIIEDVLEADESGIPKPKYCTVNPFSEFGEKRCGWHLTRPGDDINRTSTSGPDFFHMWYHDDPKYNLRVGFRLPLTVSTTGIIKFDSGINATTSFHPLTQYANAVPCLSTNLRLDCSNGGKIFPFSTLAGDTEIGTNRSFLFTTESHSFFDFQGNETFTFSGDDDFWVFINERLAIDLGGLHPPLRSKIDLSDPFVRQSLGIEVGQVYSFDLYHAERHTAGSNFAFETTFRPRCNVLKSGKVAHSLNILDIEKEWKLIGGPNWGKVDAGTILLTRKNEFNAAGYAFLRQQINVGTGFIVEFTFSASKDDGEGFAFVIQRDSIINLNGGSGGNLGFRNLKNSIGIIFDFCSDRNTVSPSSSCLKRQVRMHVPTASGESNNVFNETKLLKSELSFPNNFNDGNVHRVLIQFFAVPDWIEVYVDDDLFLQKRGFNLENIIGGRNAFIGFTSSTGPTKSADLRIHSVQAKTVAIEDGNSEMSNSTIDGSSALGNGFDTVKFTITNYDACLQPIQFGGFPHRAGGLLVTPTPSNTTTRRRLEGITIPVKSVVDNNDGTYTLQFAFVGTGNFSLIAWFGENCNETSYNDVNCFFFTKENVASFLPVPFVPRNPEPLSLFDALLIGFGSAAGFVFCVGIFAVTYYYPNRRRWQREKQFIEKGRIAALERGVVYEGDIEIEMASQKLQQVLEQLSRARARYRVNEYFQREIEMLLVEQGDLQETIRQLKLHKKELEEGDHVSWSKRDWLVRPSTTSPKVGVHKGVIVVDTPRKSSSGLFQRERSKDGNTPTPRGFASFFGTSGRSFRNEQPKSSIHSIDEEKAEMPEERSGPPPPPPVDSNNI